MTAREYLNQYRVAFRERKQLLEQLRDLEDRLMMVRSMDYGRDVVDTSPRGDAIPQAVAALLDAQAMLAEKEQEAVKRQKAVLDIIGRLTDDREREILTWRYICCRKMDQISETMFLSERQAYRTAALAEEHVQELLKDVSECQVEAVV